MACKWLHDTSSRCFVSPLNVIAAAPHSTSGCVHCSIASTQLRSPAGHLDLRAAISHDRHPAGTGLDDLGALISNISPVLGPIGTIFDDLGNLSTVIGNTIQDFGVNLVPAIDTPLFDIPVQLVNFGSALFDLLTGQPVAADASTLPDLGTLPDLSGLSDIGLSSLSGIVTDLGSTLLTLFP
jgi:hypothetical protein